MCLYLGSVAHDHELLVVGVEQDLAQVSSASFAVLGFLVDLEVHAFHHLLQELHVAVSRLDGHAEEVGSKSGHISAGLALLSSLLEASLHGLVIEGFGFGLGFCFRLLNSFLSTKLDAYMITTNYLFLAVFVVAFLVRMFLVVSIFLFSLLLVGIFLSIFLVGIFLSGLLVK